LPTEERDPLAWRLHLTLACAVLLVFAWLTTRHVGEAAFLEDQVDQLQNFEALLRLSPEGLWGGAMSGTVPPARAIGPLGAVVFGVPVALGLGIDSIHLITSLLIAIGAAALFVTLARIDRTFAWLWLLVFSTTGVVWWNAGMFWTNTLLLPLGLALAALAVSCLWRPRTATLAWLVLTGIFALQLHLVALVAAPVILIVGVVAGRDALRHVPGRTHAGVLAAVALLAVGPYVLAEALTDLRNTRAVVSYLTSTGGVERAPAVATAATTLSIAVDPMRLSERVGVGDIPVIAIGTVCAIAALLFLGVGRRRGAIEHVGDDRARRVILWLTVCAVTAGIGQALFFLVMSRPFAGFHHVTLLAPFYAVVPAALSSLLVSRLIRAMSRPMTSIRSACVLGCVCLTWLVWKGPSLADGFVERTPWSYTRIVAALDALCGDAFVDTDEGQGFAALLNPQHDSVLRYLMKRRFATCRYQQGSDVLIVAAREATYGAARVIGDLQYRLELVMPPGIARYRRWP